MTITKLSFNDLQVLEHIEEFCVSSSVRGDIDYLTFPPKSSSKNRPEELGTCGLLAYFAAFWYNMDKSKLWTFGF